MTEQIADVQAAANIRTVEAFLYAIRDKDWDTFAALVDDDLVYENVGYPTLRGGQRVVKLFRRGGMDFDVKFHRSTADGASVMNERTDALKFGRLHGYFWVCGVFEVHDGRITLWRDYFDLFDVIKGTVRGLAAMAVPALQRKF